MPSLPITVINEITGLVGQSRNAYMAMLKLQYGPQWDAWLQTESAELSKRIAQKKGTMFGQMTVSVVPTALPQAAGVSTFEGWQLPSPTTGTRVNTRMFARDVVTRLRFTKQVQNAARAGDKAAWAKPRAADLEDARLQSGLNWARKLYNGYYDILAQISAYDDEDAGPPVDPANATLYGRDSRTSGVTTPANAYNFGDFYLRVNQAVGAVDASAVTGIATAMGSNHATSAFENQISAIDSSDTTAPVVDFTPGPDADADEETNFGFTPGAGDVLVPYASRKSTVNTDADADSDYASMNGLDAIIKDSTFYPALYGLLKSSYTKLSGFHDDNAETQRPWTERRLTLMTHRIRTEGTGGKPDAAMLDYSTLREVVDENRGDRRFEPIQKGGGYSKNMQHTAGDVMTPYVADWLCPPGAVFVIDSSCFGYYEESPMSPEPETRWVANYLQEELNWHKSGNIECRKPCNNGIIDDLTFATQDLSA